MNRLVLRLIVITVALAMATSAGATTISITENFDSDPGWIGKDNRTYQTNNYGFSNTNYAGGDLGEAGGAIMARTLNRWTWYVDDLGTTLSSSDYIAASGRMILTNVTGFDGAFEIGFFNTVNPVNISSGARPGTGGIVNGIAMRIVDSTAPAVRVCPRLAQSYPNYPSPTYLFIQAGTPYLWNFTYTPLNGGSAGTLDLTLRLASDGSLIGTSSVTTDNMPSDLALNVFGICTGNMSSNKPAVYFYMDDVTYGTVPEPGTLALLGTGFVGLICCAWRKRK